MNPKRKKKGKESKDQSAFDHQFGLFGFYKPKIKIPISADKIKEAKELLSKGEGQLSAEKLREVRQELEKFERKL